MSIIRDSVLTLCKPFYCIIILPSRTPPSPPPPGIQQCQRWLISSFFHWCHFSKTLTVVATNLTVIVFTDQWLRLYRLRHGRYGASIVITGLLFESTMFAMTHATTVTKYHIATGRKFLLEDPLLEVYCLATYWAIFYVVTFPKSNTFHNRSSGMCERWPSKRDPSSLIITSLERSPTTVRISVYDFVTSGPARSFRRIKIVHVVGHVHGLRETLRVRAVTAMLRSRSWNTHMYADRIW